jgi:hypothetical protein
MQSVRTPKLPYGKVPKRREADTKKYQFNGGFTEKLKRVIGQKRAQGAKLSKLIASFSIDAPFINGC